MGEGKVRNALHYLSRNTTGGVLKLDDMIPTTSGCSQQWYEEVVTNEGNISMKISGRESNTLERKDDATQMSTDCELEQCGGAGSGREFGGEVYRWV